MKVCEKKCDQCLFGKNKIVSNQRRKEILNNCVKTDSHFQCHKGTIVGEDIVCNGFYSSYSTNLIRIMSRLGGIEMVNPESLK